MDQQRFDDLARLFGASRTRRAGLRAALGGLLGAGAGAAALDADARRGRHSDTDAGKKRRKKKTCKPACTNGFECVKVGRKRVCQCLTGDLCGDACCRIGQTCQDGRCVAEPEPGQCIAAGEPCKNVGLPCCGGRTCASGQGGERDIACYMAKTGPCQSTADCVFNTTCENGRCTPPPSPTPEPPQVIQGLGTPCNAARGDTCAEPLASCAAYNGPDAPNGEPGDYCTLPLNQVCSGDPDCTCYKCWYENPLTGGGSSRAGQTRAVSTRLACCGPAGYACRTDRNCCLGALCVNGVCQSETTCDVYASCPTPGNGCWTTIAAAYADTAAKPAGSTITIAPGTYTESRIRLDRDITFRRCGDTGTVVWQNATDVPLIEMPEFLGTPPPTASNVRFAFIEFTKNPDQNVQEPDFLFVLGGASVGQRLKMTALGCTWRDFVYSGGYAAIDAGSYTDLDLTDCTFRNLVLGSGNGAAIRTEGDRAARNTVSATRCTFDGNTGSSGGAIALKNADLTATGSTFTNNIATGTGGAIYLVQGSGNYPNFGPSSASLRDCTLTGNSARVGVTNGGGAIQVCANCTLSLSGATTITGNTAGEFGSGIAVQVFTGQANTYAPGRISVTTPATVTGNSVSPDCLVWELDSPRPKYGVTCDGWCVPSGGACQGNLAQCCSGACSSPDAAGTCP